MSAAQPYEQVLEMMERLSKIIDSYGLDVWIWYPAMDRDYSDPKTVEFALHEWGEVFRKLPRVDVVFLPDEEEEGLQLHRVVDGQRRGDKLHVLVQDSLLHREPLDPRKGSVTAWGQADLMQELLALAEGKGLALDACAGKYATASLPDKAQGWRWHGVLGFVGRA